VAAPDPVRAYAVAGAVEASRRHPALVATPTVADAERLAHDLTAFFGPDEVEVCPAWETLPFERVSPSVETMGRRLRAMWHLRGHSGHAEHGGPRVLVAPI